MQDTILYMMANPNAAEGGSPLMSMLPFVLIIGVIYFLMIRPQAKKAKQQKEMINAIKKGDKIITIGGIYGTVTEVKDISLKIMIAKGVEMEIDKNSASNVLTNNQVQPTEEKKEN